MPLFISIIVIVAVAAFYLTPKIRKFIAKLDHQANLQLAARTGYSDGKFFGKVVDLSRRETVFHIYYTNPYENEEFRSAYNDAFNEGIPAGERQAEILKMNVEAVKR
jgi:hypothetical protein